MANSKIKQLLNAELRENFNNLCDFPKQKQVLEVYKFFSKNSINRKTAVGRVTDLLIAKYKSLFLVNSCNAKTLSRPTVIKKVQMVFRELENIKKCINRYSEGHLNTYMDKIQKKNIVNIMADQ